METNISAYMPTPEKTGLNSVRARAKQQSSLRLKKFDGADHTDHGMQSASYQKLRTLKSISAMAEAERERELADTPCWMQRVWGIFQEALGNR